jgi:hypothetical protein
MTICVDGTLSGSACVDGVAVCPAGKVCVDGVSVLVCDSAPVCPAVQAVSGITGDPISFTPAAVAGNPVPVLTTSVLPGGVTFLDNGNGTGTFGGVFPAAGLNTITVVATSASGVCNYMVNLTSTGVAVAPACPADSAQGAIAGTSVGSVTTAAVAGSPTPTLAATPLPTGLSFVDNLDGTGTFTGTPTVVGSVTTTVTATNIAGSCTHDVVWTTVAASSAPSCPGATTFAANTNDVLAETTPAVTGTAVLVLTQTGLPAGVTFLDNGDGTATIGGVAPVSGSYPIVITATNGFGSCNYTYTIDTQIALVATSAPSAANPGDPDPTIGSDTSLGDVAAPGTVGSLSKSFYAVVSGITGGDGGPYEVDWDTVAYGVNVDAPGGFTFSPYMEIAYGTNGGGTTVTNTTTGIGVVGGNVAGAADTTGFNVIASTGYAFLEVAMIFDSVPAQGKSIDYSIQGTVTIRDLSGGVQTVTIFFADDFDYDGGAP